MVALSEKLCRNDIRPRDGRVCRRQDRFGRYGKSPAASESSVISVAGNYPNGGVTGNIPNGTTDSLWQGWQTMEERNPFGGSGSTDTPIKQFIWGTYIDECLQINLLAVAGPQSLPVGNYYLLQDLLFRAVALANSSGAIVEAYDCDAYGNTLVFTAPDTTGNWWGDAAVQSNYGANEIIYCGYRYDPETENYYVRNRAYSPTLGRWITRDPLGYADLMNLYLYALSSPGHFLDPSGQVTVGQVQLTLKYLGTLSERAKKGSEALEHIREAVTVVRALRGSSGARKDVLEDALDKLREAAEKSLGPAGALATAELNADIAEIRVSVELASSLTAMANKKTACDACWQTWGTQAKFANNAQWIPNPPVIEQLYLGGFNNLSNSLGVNFFWFSALATWTAWCKSADCKIYANIGVPVGKGVAYQWVPCNEAG